jgi:hypothetical protein
VTSEDEEGIQWFFGIQCEVSIKNQYMQCKVKPKNEYSAKRSQRMNLEQSEVKD